MKLNLCVKRDGQVLFQTTLLEGLNLCLTDEAGRVVSELQTSELLLEEGLQRPVVVVSVDEAEQTEGRIVPEKSLASEPLNEQSSSAEVWFCEKGEWRHQGSLSPGQQARMGEGYVRLESQGGLRVLPGPRLGGVAILPTGSQVKIEPGGAGIRLPAGSCVTMVTKARSFYVRSDFIDRPLVEHSGGARVPMDSCLQVLRSDLI